MELVAWRGVVANAHSWFPARLRAWVKRFPKVKDTLKELRVLPHRLLGAGQQNAAGAAPLAPGDGEKPAKGDSAQS